MKIIEDKLVKPKGPHGRILYEPAEWWGRCKCGASFKFSFNPFKKKKCIQSNCDNYYKGFPSADINLNTSVTINGKTIYSWRIE